MNFETIQTKNQAVIKMRVAKLDVNSAEDLKAEIRLLNKNGVNQIILDLEESKYCDSSGLSAILLANRLCKDSTGQFILVGLQPTVLKLIQIAQLDQVLHILPTLEEAMIDLNP
jgi:anti-anti-sigma factor